MEQLSLFEAGDLTSLEIEPSGSSYTTPKRPVHHATTNQYTIQDFVGFEHPDLVMKLWEQIANRVRILREVFKEILEIIAYRHVFSWHDREEYMVTVRVVGKIPFATCLGVDIYTHSNSNEQLLFWDCRQSVFEDHPKKQWIFKSAEIKDEYLTYAKSGEREAQ